MKQIRSEINPCCSCDSDNGHQQEQQEQRNSGFHLPCVTRSGRRDFSEISRFTKNLNVLESILEGVGWYCLFFRGLQVLKCYNLNCLRICCSWFLNFKIYNKPCFHQLFGITNTDFDFQKGYIEIGKVTKFLGVRRPFCELNI